MKNLLYTLLLFPVLVFAQNQDPCYSINNYNTLLLETNPILPTDLPEGWSMFGFSCSDSIDAIVAFEQVAGKIVIVKDEWGLSYLPDWGFNALGYLKPSEGYQIKMNAAVSNFSFCERLSLPLVAGCADCQALNFDAWATTDDGSCNYDTDGDGIYDADEVEGCRDLEACNYDSEATEEEDSCTYPTESYLDCSGACVNDSDMDSVCDEAEVDGCMNADACNYNSEATDADDSCSYPSVAYLDCSGICLNDTDDDGVCDEIEIDGCVNPDACNYDTEATEDDGFCTYPSESHLDCAGDCLNDSDDDGVCDEFEIAGCLDVAACNYNVQATDAGACSFAQDGYDCDGNTLFQVGQEHMGGTIFWMDPDHPGHGLVVKNTDEYSPYPNAFYFNQYHYPLNTTDLSATYNATTEQWSGGGKSNTEKIKASSEPYHNSGLKDQLIYVTGDWWVPSKAEMQKLYDAKDQLENNDLFTPFTDWRYWSSSETPGVPNKSWYMWLARDGKTLEYTWVQNTGEARLIKGF
jgi:hypothetical protein